MDNYIYVKRKAFNQDQCKGIIDLFEKSEPKYEDPDREYIAVSTSFESESTFFMKDIVMKNIKEYTNKYDFLKTLYVTWGLTPSFNIQKYLPGKSYGGEHMEHGKDERDSRRLLGWMIYLNDIKNKGGTCWPQQRFTTKPRAGDLYIWPAGWTHSHYGVPAPNEIKYIVTGWCHMYDE